MHLQINQLQNWIWQRMKASRVMFPMTIILKHHDRHHTHGQLNLAFSFLIFSLLFLALAFYIKVDGAAALTINEAVYHLFRGIRQPMLDSIMICITLLGQKQVLYPVILITFGYLLYSKHYREASHALMLAIFAVGGVFIFKHVIMSPRPWGIFSNAETYSMPSGHTVLAVTLYFGLAFLIATSMRIKSGRWMIYTAALIICIAVSMSRVYLGAHWFTDVFSSWLLSGAILCFVIISYERAKVIRVNPKHIFLLTLVSLALSFALYTQQNYTKLLTNYTQLDWPIIAVNMDDWWANDNEVPDNRTSLFGFPSQPVNVQWVGSLEDIRKTLASEGWSKPPARDWVSTLHRIADIRSTQYLPMISPQYQDKKPALIMTKSVTGIKNLLVIRIWDSSRIIAENNKPLWVATIGIVPRTYGWFYKKQRNNTLDLQPKLIFSDKTTPQWTYKMVDITLSGNFKQQKILLIRPNT